ncbi:MAG: 4Fe-4S binding protein [Clostridiales Family XIII bacterium]|jgi:ferredoxin|nr:4Fe-4S binding protein [Clostridiales Family XIII bacterium]
MIRIDEGICEGCRICEKNCPLGAIRVEGKLAVVGPGCASCNVCVRVCPFGAASRAEDEDARHAPCSHCSVGCSIEEGHSGACTRYVNRGGRIRRARKLVLKAGRGGPAAPKLPPEPLTTAVGAGTNYPCCRPAPYIVEDRFEGADVVTVVTEAPLSYSGVKVKIDANRYIGEEGARVKRDGKVVGHVTTEEYGSKMLSIGGANLLSHGNDGFVVARTIVDFANGRRVKLRVEGGSELELQHGHPPVIDGEEEALMRVGCGSATVGMFPEALRAAADEAIVLDYHVIGLLTEHLAGAEIGLVHSGVVPRGVKSSRGRYFGNAGIGWGGTDIQSPLDAIASVDMAVARPGMTVLVTETTGQRCALLRLRENGLFQEIPLTPEAEAAAALIRGTCEQACVSVIYTGGTGGSARAGVTKTPKKLNDAVHEGRVRMTVGGAPVFLLPGGGINFMVDIGRMAEDAVTWVPTPATVAPVEYTMEKATYEALGGHTAHIITVAELLRQLAEAEQEQG